MRLFKHKDTQTKQPAAQAYLHERDDEVGVTIRALANLIHKTVPEATEGFYHGAVRYCVGGYPFCYLVALKDHINLGFFYGTELPDPDKLLEGTGKSMRHVKVVSLDKELLPELITLISGATADIKKRIDNQEVN